jgi:HD-GYP domain-containing protein (c-di-GMP phosphodiesterase class II)
MSQQRKRARQSACVIFHGPNINPADFRGLGGLADSAAHDDLVADEQKRAHERRLCRPWRAAAELFADPGAETGPTVLLVDDSMHEHFDAIRQLPKHVIIVAADEATETALEHNLHLSVAGMALNASRIRVLRAACRLSCARVAGLRWYRRVVRSNRELRALNQLGASLMLERRGAALYRQIVSAGKQFTQSDLGALFLVKTGEDQTPRLVLAYNEIDTVHIESLEGFVAVDNKSAIGHSAVVKHPLVIADVHNLPVNAGFTRTAEIEEKYGFYMRSMLIVPMLDRTERVVGVLVFANRKSEPKARITSKEDADQYVLPYTGREVRLARSLASQAAVSIENARLYEQIERIFESFVTASASAIDQRDPTTAGHSIRVAALTTDLATAVDRATHGTYADVRFSADQMRELRFAALLHDFGKITVSEDVLLKAKKLPPLLWERVNDRFDLIRRTLELEHYKSRHPATASELEKQIEQLERMRAMIRTANEPTVQRTRAPAELAHIAQRTFERPNGTIAPYLETEELKFLQLTRGTLDEQERAEIESHVEQTYRFLRYIPWTDDLSNLVTFAYGHHEKLDGSGYPRHLTADQIPLQTRIMTVADIFDALTESDRPYKRAVAPDRALDILQSEVTAGRLDAQLVNILVESRVYTRILEVPWRELDV